MASGNESKPSPTRRMTAKIVVSLFIGGMAYFITERLLKDDEPMALMTSVFIAGVVFVAQFLYDVDSRVEKLNTTTESHLDSVELRLNNNLDELGHAAHLVQLLAKSPLPVDKFDRLLHDTINVTTNHSPLTAALARSEVDRLCKFMQELRSHKSASYPGEDRDWLLTLTAKASKSIKAISLTTVDAGGENFVDGGLWRSDLGIRYLDGQEGALTMRNVTVQRIFVSDLPDDSATHLLAGIINEQRELGIEVRILHPKAIRGTAASKLHGYIVFDDDTIHETTAAVVNSLKDTPKTLTTKINTDVDTVADKSKLFDLLWSQAQEPEIADAPGHSS